MPTDYIKLHEIRGNLIVLTDVENPSYNEIVTIKSPNHPPKTGRIIQIHGSTSTILVFEDTRNLSLDNTTIRLTGRPMELPLSTEILGRIFDGMGRPKDGLGPIQPERTMNINGSPYSPVLRRYPNQFLQTGISAIDGLTSLIRGQKLPIFSCNGLPHDRLAAQIARQANCSAIVFAAMGAKNDTAEYFRRSFEESGVPDRVVMYLNLANDPVTERILTPRLALTAAEYLAFEKEMDVLVILTDMTAYAEALRELSMARGEIPSRKGYPGYLYSDLASIYERAGLIKKSKGSLTQIPILTMPSDDISHPVPDLTGYITEGQVVLDRNLHSRGIYPPINILPSLSRLMKDGVGENRTHINHPAIAAKLFAAYAQVGDARALAAIVGHEDVGEKEKKLLHFGQEFEEKFIHQGQSYTYKSQVSDQPRALEETLALGQKMLEIL